MKDTLCKILGGLSLVYILAVILVFPFYYEKYYFNMLEAKSHAVMIVSILFLTLSFVSLILIFMKESFKKWFKVFLKGLNLTDYAMAIFMIAAIMSNLVTAYKSDALMGSFGWSVGTLYLVAMVLVYFFVSRWGKAGKYELYALFVVLSIIYIWVILNGIHVDPLGFHENLATDDYVRYVACIGNVNWYVGFFALTMPFFLMYSVVGEKAYERLASCILIMLGTMTTITVNSDGVFLGLLAMIFFFLLFSSRDKLHMERAMRTMIFLSVGIFLVWLLRFYTNMVEITGFGALVIKPKFFGTLLWLSLAFSILFNRLKETHYTRAKYFVRALLIALLILFAFYGISYITKDFSEKWGHNRGKIWMVAIEAYRGFNPLQKIFGGGSNCFGYYYMDITGSDWVRNAHNEYLEYLVTTGALGFISYVAIYLSVLIYGIREMLIPRAEGDNLLKNACFIAILSYGAQAIVNNPMALNGVIFVTVLALYRGSLVKRKPGLKRTKKHNNKGRGK